MAAPSPTRLPPKSEEEEDEEEASELKTGRKRAETWKWWTKNKEKALGGGRGWWGRPTWECKTDSDSFVKWPQSKRLDLCGPLSTFGPQFRLFIPAHGVQLYLSVCLDTTSTAISTTILYRCHCRYIITDICQCISY